jgi:ABC-type antimicrobial peptide transport system permease subunit
MNQPFDNLPIWAVYVLTVLLLLAAVEAGYRYAKAKHRTAPGSDEGLGAITGAALGMLAFVLAFVIGFGMNLNGDRRELVLNEANAIRSTYLRAGYLVEPYRTDSRNLLSEYLDQRLAAVEPGKLEQAKARSEEIQGELWAIAEKVVIEVDKSDTISAYLDSLNQVITVHAERVVKGLQMRIPPPVLWAVYAMSVIIMFMVGMLSGYAPNRSITALVMLAVVFGVVLYLIVDMDRSDGLVRVSQQPLIDLRSVLGTLP